MLLKEGFAACHCMYRWRYDSQEHGIVINVIGNKKNHKRKQKKGEQSSMYKAIYSSGEIT